MSAPHLFAESVLTGRIVVTGDDAHHAVRVLRLKPGERVTVSDGAGSVADGVVVRAGKDLEIEVSDVRTEHRRPPVVTVFQGIPKSGKLELVVQKLTELGVDEIVPLKTARSIGRLESSSKIERLRTIAREAAKQSHRAWLPRVSEPAGMETAARRGGLALILHEEAGRGLLESLPSEVPEEISLLIGPEGGFSPDEVASLEGAVAVSLGRQILRTETAALVAAALVFGRYGRIG